LLAREEGWTRGCFAQGGLGEQFGGFADAGDLRHFVLGDAQDIWVREPGLHDGRRTADLLLPLVAVSSLTHGIEVLVDELPGHAVPLGQRSDLGPAIWLPLCRDKRRLLRGGGIHDPRQVW